MTTPHTPPTQAELDAWRKPGSRIAASALTRLIAEVERLTKENVELQHEVSELHKFAEKHGIKGEHGVWETLDRLAKDKERLDWLEKQEKIPITATHKYVNASLKTVGATSCFVTRQAIDSAILEGKG